MKKTIKRFLCSILVLTLVLSGMPGIFSPAERVYAAGNGLYQVECTRSGANYSFIIMHERPVLLSRILMGVGLKNKTVSVAPTFSPDSGFTVTYEKINNKDDWWISYDGSLADGFECDMTVVSDTTYTIHLKKLNKAEQPTTGTWKNKDSIMMCWTYLDGTLTLSPDNAGESGTLSMYGEKDDFGLDKSAGTNTSTYAAYWIPEVPWKFWIDDITEVVIKAGVTSIGQQAFRRHTNLESVKIEGDTLAKIGKCAFYDCSSLTMLDLRGCPSLTEIESSSTEGPFIGTKLETILLSPALTTIPVKLFSLDGSKLTKVNLSDLIALESIEQEAFRRDYGNGAPAITDYNGGNLNLNKQTKLTTIGKDAFRNQDGLDPRLVIASPVLTTIAEGAFSAYTAQYGVLERVDLSACASLETIGKEAFLNQKNLKSIVFPDAFTWVDKDAFKSCTGLSLPTADIAYCLGGNGALYNVKADGSATRVLNDGEDTLSWITTAIAAELPYTDAAQALVNGPTLCPETGSYSIKYTLDGGSETDTIPTAKGPGTYAVGYTVTLPDGTTTQSGTINVTIANPTAIASSMLSLDKASFEYDGNTHTQVLTVKDGTTDLIEDTDYTVDTTSVTSAQNVGNYTISVTGKGVYANTASISWKIEDTTAPVISGVTDGATYTEAANFSVSDLLLSTVTLQKDSETPQSLTVSSGSASGTASENGTYTIVAKDTSGNTTNLTFTIAIPEPEPGTDPEPPVAQQAETPVIDPAGGSFKGSVDVTITCGTPGATIRYTTDGTDPDAANGTVYTSGSAITLTRSTTLKAIAVADGYTDSGIASADFRKRSTRKDEEEIPDDGPPLVDPFPFTDVTEEDYSREAVEWAVDNGVTSGTTPTTFSPKADAARAQVITSLWAAAGSPEPTTAENPFTDVSENDYFYKAVLWAYENGITSGVSSDLFGADDTVTRAQAITFLWAAAGSPEPTLAENPFADVSEDDYYYKAVLWAYENGITVGTGAATFSPDAECLREQIITFLYLTYGKE